MAKKTKPRQEDIQEFHDAMHGIKPHRHDKIRLKDKKPKIEPPKPKPNATEYFKLRDESFLDPITTDDFLQYQKAGIHHKTLRKLKKGQYNIEAVLDLHGKTTVEARIAVDNFIHDCLQQDIRVVLIIHGKGHHSQNPILKNNLNNWLRQLPPVLAFCSAIPKHGGHGATYILLKHSTKGDEFE